MAAAGPIEVYRVDGGAGHPTIRQYPEDAAETFGVGVPVTIDSDGMVARVSSPITEPILGFSAVAGANLTTQNTAEMLSAGTPRNQSSATTIPPGAPMNDGKIAVVIANSQTEFRAALVDGQTYTDTLLDTIAKYELSLNANGYFEVDSTNTGTDADNLVQITGVDPNNDEFVLIKIHELDGAGTRGRVH